MGRRLIYVPIIHTEVDMGSLAESFKKEYMKKYGTHKWEQHLKKINDLWMGIEERLNQKKSLLQSCQGLSGWFARLWKGITNCTGYSK